jgi:predicted nuclease of predicted toxin-antitoxin system
MNFLVDAHLPLGLCKVLAARGHDALQTTNLPDHNRTKDRQINQISIDEQRVVNSKDADFFYSHILQGRPWKLLLVKTGNISTRELTTLFSRNLLTVETAFNEHTLVEIDRFTVRPIKVM